MIDLVNLMSERRFFSSRTSAAQPKARVRSRGAPGPAQGRAGVLDLMHAAGARVDVELETRKRLPTTRAEWDACPDTSTQKE